MATTASTRRKRRQTTLRPHPTRDAIVDLMGSYGEPISPTRIANALDLTLGSVAYHVRTLNAAGVVELAGEGRVRGAVEHHYVLAARKQEDGEKALKALLGVSDMLTVPDPGGGYPIPVELDDLARQELTDVLGRLTPRVQKIAERAVARGKLTRVARQEAAVQAAESRRVEREARRVARRNARTAAAAAAAEQRGRERAAARARETPRRQAA